MRLLKHLNHDVRKRHLISYAAHLRKTLHLDQVLPFENQPDVFVPRYLVILTDSHFQVYGAVNGRDRKSTRLNSSHVAISYAVFCLKKKTNEHTCDGRIEDVD